MKHLLTGLALLGFALLTIACGEEAPQGATADEYKAERERLMAQLAKKKKAIAPVPVAAATADPEASEGGFGSVAASYTYDQHGKRDPFQAYQHNRSAALGAVAGPLLAYELEQLSVVALVWSTNNPRALVADPRGETHVVREGSPIGKNDGLVIHIGDNMVLVKETYVDFAGEMTTKDVELQIRRSQGG